MTQYNETQLQAIFQSKYDATNWQNILIHIFGATELRTTPEKLDVSTENETGYYLG
jgi:hypothetical protein